MAAHAKLSPSGSSRWMTCPGSVALIDTLPVRPDSESVYAKAGTAMHEVCEKCLDSNKYAFEFLGKKVYGVEITADHVKIAQKFIDFVRQLGGVQFYELRTQILDDGRCFGTVDAVAINKKHLTIVDLKTGAGVLVEALNNTQLLCYALGAWKLFREVYDFKKITLCIVQPPLNNYSSMTVTVKELKKFEKKLLRKAEETETKIGVYKPSEKACRWCEAQAICPALKKEAAKFAAADFKNEDPEIEELEAWMKRIPVLKNAIAYIEGRVKDLLLEGAHVPGFKVVEGRRSKEWSMPPKKLIKKLKKLGLKEAALFHERKMLSPAQMRDKLKIDINPFTRLKPGSPTIAKEKDSRPPIDKTASAVKDFTE